MTGTRRPSKPEPTRTELRMTAMMDVCFLLLIFFVATATFVKNEGLLAADLPGRTDAPHSVTLPQMDLPIHLYTIGSSNDLHIDIGRGALTGRFDESLIRAKLSNLQYRTDQPYGLYEYDTPIVITPTGDVEWEAVVGTVNAARAAGYANVTVFRYH